MKNIYKYGDRQQFIHLVTADDTATFKGSTIHPVYATFALARDAEWCSRLFVLQMKEDHEEGIGTFVHVNHLAPALVGQTVVFEAVVEEIKGNALHCTFTAKVGDRLIAEGRTGQKVLPKEKIDKLLEGLKT